MPRYPAASRSVKSGRESRPSSGGSVGRGFLVLMAMGSMVTAHPAPPKRAAQAACETSCRRRSSRVAVALFVDFAIARARRPSAFARSISPVCAPCDCEPGLVHATGVQACCRSVPQCVFVERARLMRRQREPATRLDNAYLQRRGWRHLCGHGRLGGPTRCSASTRCRWHAGRCRRARERTRLAARIVLAFCPLVPETRSVSSPDAIAPRASYSSAAHRPRRIRTQAIMVVCHAAWWLDTMRWCRTMTHVIVG
jgi:hypothetical protein